MDDILTDSDAQRLYLNGMLSTPELFARVNHILQPAYFDPQFQGGVKFMKEYFTEYRSTPSIDIFKASTKLTAERVEIGRADVRFIAEQIAKFCQVKAVIQAVRQSPKMIEDQNFGGLVELVKSAAQIGLVDDLGIEYFANVRERIEKQQTQNKRISTGWKDVDEVLDGGVSRQELITFLAPSGGGKSVSMLNLARNFMAQGLHGVYISLEMADHLVAQRTDAMIARIASGKIAENVSQVVDSIEKFGAECGVKFFVKRMREGTTNCLDILAYLRELEATHGFRPDFIVVDYLDILASVQTGHSGNMFLKDQFVSQEVRAIGFDYNCIMISASQLGKHATEAINEGKAMHQGDVQGGSSKTNTSDLMIAVVRPESMLETGECRFEFPKARNSGAAGKKVMMTWDSISLRIGNHGDLNLKKKEKDARTSLVMNSVRPGQSRTLSDLTAKLNAAQGDK